MFPDIFRRKKAAGFLVVLAVAVATVTYFLKPYPASQSLTYPEFVEKLASQKIASVKLVGVDMVTARLEGDYLVGDGSRASYSTPVLLAYANDLKPLLTAHGFPAIEQAPAARRGLSAGEFATIGLVLLMSVVVASQFGLIDISRSVARPMSRQPVTFADVAGVDDVKRDIMEVVDLIKNRSRIAGLGGSVPKGLLLVGPPGTGKTLLAKAIAGEAGVPFFEISGSAFVEKYVGTGAARVRTLFKQARKNAPCIVFIDELDAVGGRRSDSGEGSAREHNQTLNALLVELDGVTDREGVVIVAATNRRESLDPALLRPGRFDRHLSLSLPDIQSREAILRVHARSMKLASDVKLAELARATVGFSGADLASVLNEAALSAGRRSAKEISRTDLDTGRDRVLLGAERTSLRLTEADKWRSAVHEAGHTVVNHFVKAGQKLERVTILPRGAALGATLLQPEENSVGETRDRLRDHLCVLMAGRAAEEVFIGDISSGAAGDIAQATRCSKKMVCEWGMSEKFGLVRFDANNEEYLTSRGATAAAVDAEVAKIIRRELDRSRHLVETYREEVELIALELMKRETLSAADVEALFQDAANAVAVPDISVV